MMASVYQIAKADLLERIRRRGFLVTLFLTVLFSYIFSPPREGKYVTLVFDHYVGLYNSAWMGTTVAISFSVFFSLIGFYFISKAVDVDRQAGTGPIICASPVSRSRYILGKYFSNLSILSIIAVITMLSALIMQWVRGEDMTLDLWALASPFLFMTLPLIALMSAIAIWFEVIPWLRGTVGNTVYFILWIVTVFMGMQPLPIGSHFILTDPFARSIPMNSIAAALKEQFPGYNGEFSLGLTFLDEKTQSFIWHGVDWSLPVIFGRLAWIAAALILAWIAALFFNRFHEKSSSSANGAAKPEPGSRPSEHQQPVPLIETIFSSSSLTPVRAGRGSFLSLLWAEMKLMLSGKRTWLLAAALLMVLCFILPFDAAARIVWPLAWVWPLGLWSAMGNREQLFRTSELIYSAPGRISRQLHAVWLAGVVLSILISAGIAIRLCAQQEWMMLAVWAAGAVFVPTLALACGVWTRGGRCFEIIYLSIWYIGPLNGLPVVNFMDLTAGRVVLIYLVVALTLYLAALAGRIKRLNE